MKKVLFTSVLSLILMVSVTACGSGENNQTSETKPEISAEEVTTEAKKIYQTGEPVTDPEFETLEMQDIQQLIDNIHNDTNFDVNTMYYELSAEKVMVNGNDFDKDGDNVQVVVVCRVEKPDEDKKYYKVVAAEKDFYDTTTDKGPNLEKRTVWKFEDNGYYAWSAESIIKSALDYLNMSADDMEMYKHYIIDSNFPE